MLALGLLSIAGGCSFKKVAINEVGNALAGSGTTFASDEDPELIKAAAPFSLKLMESLLAESPRHKELLLAASSGFAQYAYAFVQLEADEAEDYDEAQAMRERARKLFLRARDYGLRGLDVRHRGFRQSLAEDPHEAIETTRKKDVPLLYWTATAWAAAISVLKDDADLIADIGVVEALMDRALELDEAYDYGAIHTFLITYEMSRQGGEGSPSLRAQRHFESAVALSEGLQAAPFVAFAEAVCVQEQDLPTFREMLNQALSIDVDARPEWRMVNLIMQRRARWLLSRTEDLFLVVDGE